MIDAGRAVFAAVANFGPLIVQSNQASRALGGVDRAAEGIGVTSVKTGRQAGGMLSGIVTGAGRAAAATEAAGRRMTLGLTAPILFIGTTAVRNYGKFERSIVQAGQKAGATNKEIEQMYQLALKLGSTSVFSDQEVATAMDNMAAAGLNARQIMRTLPAVIDAAQASSEDLGLTASTVVQVMNAFNITSDKSAHIADAFTAAANNSALSMQGIADAMHNAAVLGPAAHQSLEDVLGTLESLAQQGQQPAMAGTAVRQFLQFLQSPPSLRAVGVIKLLGIRLRDTHGQMLPLPNIIRNLDNSLKDSNPEFEKLRNNSKLSNDELQRMQDITGMSDAAFRSFLTMMKGSSQEARDMALNILLGVQGTTAFNLASSKTKLVVIDVARDVKQYRKLVAGLNEELGPKAAKAFLQSHTALGKFSASGADAVQALSALNKGSDGAAKATAKVISQTMQQRLANAKDAIIALSDNIIRRAEPAINTLTDDFTSLVNWMQKFVEIHPNSAVWGVYAAAVLAALGPVLLIVGRVTKMLIGAGRITAGLTRGALGAGNLLLRPQARGGAAGAAGAGLEQVATLRPLEVFWLRAMPVIIAAGGGAAGSRVAGQPGGSPGRGKSGPGLPVRSGQRGTPVEAPVEVPASPGRLSRLGRAAGTGVLGVGAGAAAGAGFAAATGGSGRDIAGAAVTGGLIQGGTVGLIAGLEKLLPLLGRVTAAGAKAAGSFLAIKAAEIGTAVWTGIVTAATWAWNVAIMAVEAQPLVAIVLLIIAAIVLLGFGIYELVKHWHAVYGAMKTVAEFIGKGFTAAWHALLGLFHLLPAPVQHALEAVGRFFAAGWQKVVDLTTTAWRKVTGAVTAGWRAVVAAGAFVWRAITKPIVTAFNAVFPIVKTALHILWDIFEVSAKIIYALLGLPYVLFRLLLSWIWSKIGGDVMRGLSAVYRVFRRGLNLFLAGQQQVNAALLFLWRLLSMIVMGIVHGITRGLAAEWRRIEDSARKAWTGITTAIHAIWSVIGGPIMAVVHALEKALSVSWGGIHRTASDAWGKIAGAISTAFSAVGKAISAVWDGVKTGFVEAINFITQDVLNPFLKAINWILDRLPGHFKIQLIPKIDDGPSGPPPRPPGPGGRAVFKDGGVLPGYTPGRDVHRFSSPTAGELWLSGGEGILRPEVVVALGGPAAIDALNAPHNRGRAGGGRRYAGGGILGSVKDFVGDRVGELRAGVADVVMGSLHTAEHAAVKLLGSLPGNGVPRAVGQLGMDYLNRGLDAFLRGKSNEAQKQAAAQAAAITGPNLADRIGYVRILIQQAQQRGLGRQAMLIALISSLTETGLRNYANAKIPESLRLPHDAVGSDGYSAGLEQQQTGPFGTYWGTVAQVMNPAYAFGRFFQELTSRVPGYASMDPGAAAQAVQKSAFPDRYDQQIGAATGLLDQLLNARSGAGGRAVFDNGGWWKPGLGANLSGRPEAVLTPPQWADVSALLAGTDQLLHVAAAGTAVATGPGKVSDNRDAGKFVHVEHLDVHNAVPEPTSDSLPSALRKAARVGVD
jgi:TP901 family phage tail tape measure protein